MKAEGWQRLIPDETTRQWFRYAVMRWALSYFITLLVWAVGIPGMGAAAALIFLLSFSFLRKYAGGFHASSVLWCLRCSLFQIVLCAYILYPAMAKSPALFALTLAGSAFRPPRLHFCCGGVAF